MPSDRIRELDGVRGLAIVFVLIWHYATSLFDLRGPIGHAVYRSICWTWSGVDLFFVLSGFLIVGILMRHSSCPHYFRTFYARRVLRIIPLYYLLILGFILFRSLGLQARFYWLMAHPFPMWSYFAFVQNFLMGHAWRWGPPWLGITWSLAVEEQFYLLMPLLIFAANKRYLPLIFGAGILAAPVIRAMLPHLCATVLLPARMDSILIGALIAYYFENERVRSFLLRGKNMLRLLFVVFFIPACYMFDRGPAWKLGGSMIHSLLGIAYGFLVLIALICVSDWEGKFLRQKALAFLGKIPYCVYLIHSLVLGLLYPLILKQDPKIENLNGFLVACVALVLTIFVAALSYRYFEKPILDYAKRFKY
ncbi:MAG: acyltransferase [Candidatus Omnitrophica bacterium]|nr:acyltransferase [Candidatus Omnitrophota bacterium]MDD5670455.1 acyltransferase [Candidatus Omnitrophota bacterium]